VEQQNNSLDPVRRDQKPTLATELISAGGFAITLSERSGTSRHIKAIVVVDSQMESEELIDFLLKSPV
jgi:hypothetical protein